MDFQVVEKGQSFPVKDKAGVALTKVYIGAGWAKPAGQAVDLDLVGALLVNGKLTNPTRIVYYGDKTEPGVQLSADNQTGEGDGDDENMTIDFSQVEADVTEIAVGVVAYKGADLSTAKEVVFRIVNGTKATDAQVMEVKVAEGAKAGDTVVYGAKFVRGTDGWTLENVSQFFAKGCGADTIKGWAGLFA